jgi:GNAT superfamily N-acetyltransferase
VDRRWHGATVLYRYEHGETPDEWRAFDDAFVAWSVEVQRELAVAGAPRCGSRCVTARRSRGSRSSTTGRASPSVEDVIVHPVHRRRGIAAALTAKAIATHLAVEPATRVGIAAAPGSGAERIYGRLGFRPHAVVWTARTATGGLSIPRGGRQGLVSGGSGRSLAGVIGPRVRGWAAGCVVGGGGG